MIIPRPAPARLVPHLCLDLGYDDLGSRREAAQRRYIVHIRGRSAEVRPPRRHARKRSRRWVVERTHAWLHRFRRVLIRWERKVRNYEAILHFACALFCLRAAKAV